MRTALVIPARYGSTRLPGKPLAMIAGQTLLQRVVAIARAATENDKTAVCVVATDDERIAAHARGLGVACVMTPEKCQTGTDRVALAAKQLEEKPDFVLNVQGDAPFTPPDFLRAMIDSFRAAPCDLVTPVARMTWEELEALRENKKTTPFSGTTAVFDEKTGRAFWFSKNILPALRNEKELRGQTPLSPVWRHIGLYGYARAALENFVALPEGRYETLEGLEQLRLIENGHEIRCVPVDYKGRASMSGIDSPEDIARAEALIANYGELIS